MKKKINTKFIVTYTKQKNICIHIYSVMSYQSGKEYKQRQYLKNTKHTDNRTNNKFPLQTLTSTDAALQRCS